MYPACILHVSCMYSEGYVYPECILMYLKCILHALLHSKRIHVSFTFCMYFTRIPNESKIHFGIHIKYIKIHVSWALPWWHTGYMSRYNKIHHDSCILDSSSGYIRIQRDTKSRYMYLGRVMTNTCGIHARIYAGYMRDTCICSGSRIHRGYMRDTSGIHHERHVSQMYAERYVSEVQDTCEIHAGYMYPQR